MFLVHGWAYIPYVYHNAWASALLILSQRQCEGLEERDKQVRFPRFFYVVWKGLPLTVPTGSRTSYATAYAWRDFYNIVEGANLGIETTVTSDGVSVQSRNGHLLVTGASGLLVTLSDLQGRILYRGTATEPLTVEAPATGIYLLQVEGHPAHRISAVR